MAQDLPDDVWSQIAETQSQLQDRGALHNMSVTSKRIHRLVVPLLFHNLKLHIIREESESIMVQLIRFNMRVRFLSNSPALLRHTRVFTLWENPYAQSMMARYLAPHEGLNGSSWRDAENLLAVLQDAIFCLIFRMPGLRELRLSNIAMTPLSYPAISSRPLLTSLALEPGFISNITSITPALPEALRLRDLEYCCDCWKGNERSTDPYLTDILDHCILSLEKMVISSILLPLVVPHIPLHHTLSLRSLTVWSPLYDSRAAAAFLQVLRASPQLRHLDFAWELPDVEPEHYLPPPILPNLTTFSGAPGLLQRLSEGTNLIKIEVFDSFYLEIQSLPQVIRSSPTNLRELCMKRAVVSQSPHELLTFIRSLAVFHNLERLTILYIHYMPWKDHVNVQDSHSAIKDILSQLACLRFLDIDCHPFGRVDGYDIGCPISKQGEPADRGHPSLEALYVDFLCGMWSWDPRTGWERSDWAVKD